MQQLRAPPKPSFHVHRASQAAQVLNMTELMLLCTNYQFPFSTSVDSITVIKPKR